MNSQRFARAWSPYLVLVGSLLLTAVAAYQVAIMAAAQDHLRFQDAVGTIYDNVQNRMETYLALLRGTSGLFAASDEVTRDEFYRYITRLGLRERYPGIQGIGFSVQVRREEKEAFEAEMRQQGLNDFQIEPETPRDEYHAIIYLEPLDLRNRAAIGYDMFTNPTRRAAMESARATGLPTASGKVTLVQEIDEQKQAGFLIYLPVYRGGRVPATEAERQQSFVGFAYSPFRADDLMQGVMGEHEFDVGFEIYDGPEMSAERLLHRSHADSAARRPLLTAIRRMQVGGRPWTLYFATRPEFEASSSRELTHYILLGGVGISLALFAVTRAQARARAAAERLAGELSKSRDALAESEERLRALADAIPQLAWMAEPDGYVFWFNQRWYEYTGMTPEQMEGWGWQAVHDPAMLPVVIEQWRATIAAGTPFEMEFPLRRHDGKFRWFLTRVTPLCDTEGRVVRWFGTNTDIDDLRQAREELRQARDTLERRVEERTAELAAANRALRALNRELERSNRELQEFAFVASHDLQEPLRKVQAFGDLLREHYADRLSDEGRDFVERMQKAARRMHVLINDLLTFSRVTTKARPFVPVDLNRIAREVLEDLEARLRQTGGRVEIGALPTVEADPLQMRQLLQNLIGNALKFHRADVPPVVKLSAENSNNNHCRLLVADNGIGFEEKYLDRIFTPFQRLHSRGEYEGTGMGLAVCRKIVERHGGHITARSTPGAGATFIVLLPLKHMEEEAEE